MVFNFHNPLFVRILRWLAGAAALAGLFAIGRHNFLLFHSLVELFSMVIIAGIGVLVLNTWRRIDNPYLLFLGLTLPFVGVVGLLHTLVYKGMGVFGHLAAASPEQFWRDSAALRAWEANTATQLWIVQRYLLSLAFLAAPLCFRWRMRAGAVLGVVSAAVALALASIFIWGVFPDCLVAPRGLTLFKIASEIVISLIFFASILTALRRRAQFDPAVLRLILGAIALALAADLTFTLYRDPYQVTNMLGHLLCLASFYFIYKAILVTGFTHPQDLLYRNLKSLAARLERTNRAKDDFMAMLGHELRNPLSPIMNTLHVLQLRGAADEGLQRSLDVIMRQSKQMARLVDDLLDVSRISRGKVELRPARMDLAQIARHAVESCQTIFKEKNHSLEVALPDGPLDLTADPARIEQVLVNLLTNAAKYTNPGGKIWLRVSAEDGEAVIRVRDNGMGLSAEMLEEIFEPFSQVGRTLDRAQGGLGLGLALVRNLVKMHGGSVKAHSAGPGHGSEFTVRLPLRHFVAHMPAVPGHAHKD